MYAIIEACGRQYKVQEGETIFFEKLDAEEGKKVSFDKNDTISIGIISGAKGKGIPLGKNVLSQPIFFFFIPIITLNNKAIKDKLPTAVK